MADRKIRELLGKLDNELQRKDLDPDTRTLVTELQSDINEMLAAETEEAETDSLIEKAKSLEAQFATEHPAAERFMREVIDALVRMGI
jgi:hypothetical protein